MIRSLRNVLLAVLSCFAALTIGADFRTRAQESYACPSGKTSCYQSGYAGLTEEQGHGRDTWYFWTGGDLDASGKQVGSSKTSGRFDLTPTF